METLELLGIALGLASLAGINLYLTVFATGLAVRLQWITLSPEFESLAILSDPIVIGISGTFFFFEFFADKIPWVDSMWDGVHTMIRPVGGAFLAIMVLGDANPIFDVVVALLGGGTALATHSVKATSRLVVNASPEPFSNIAASLAEDGIVLGGLALLAWNPIVGLVVFMVAMATILFAAPKLFRCLRVRFRFAWKKLTEKAETSLESGLPREIPVDVDCLLHKSLSGEVRVEWAIPATSSRVVGIPANVEGFLFRISGGVTDLYWAGKVWFRYRLVQIPFTQAKTSYEKGFLFDRLTIYIPTGNQKTVLLIARPAREAALLACASMDSMAIELTSTNPEPKSPVQELTPASSL